MRKNILRVAIGAALIASLSACTSSIQDARLNMPTDPGEWGGGIGRGLKLTIKIGKAIDGPITNDSLDVRCGGCVKEIKPNRIPLGTHEPCNPLPCTEADIEMKNFEQGVAVMRAMLRAHHRGVELEIVMP